MLLDKTYYITDKITYDKTSEMQLRAFLASKKNEISGVKRGMDSWQNFMNNSDFLLATKEFTSIPESGANYYYNNKGERRWLSANGWKLVQEFLDDCTRIEIKDRKNATPELKVETAKVFLEYCKGQTYLTSFIKTSGTETPHLVLSDIFCQAFANNFFKDSENVDYLSLSKDMGMMLIDFVARSLDKRTINMALKEQKLATTLRGFEKNYNYIKILLNKGFFDPQSIILLPENVETEKEFIDIFIEMFHLHELRYKFSPKDLCKFARLCSIMIIARIYNLSETQKNLELTKMQKGIYAAMFPKKKVEEETDANHAYIAGLLEHEIEVASIKFGHDALSVLKGEIIIVGYSRKPGKPLEKTPQQVRLVNEEFFCELPSELPCVFLKQDFTEPPVTKETIEKPNVEKDGLLRLKINKVSETAINNYYITGEMKDEAIFQKNQKTNKFAVNCKFTLDFFELLFEIKPKVIALKCYLDALDLKNDIAISPKNLESIMPVMQVIGQLYEVNLHDLWLSANDNLLKKLLLHLCVYAVDFQNFNKIYVNEDDKASLTEYWPLFKKIRDKIRSKKIIFNQIFYQLSIMLNFNYFYYSWFSDARGRKQMSSLLTLQNMSIVRCFIEFQDVPTMYTYCQNLIEENPQDFIIPRMAPSFRFPDYELFAQPLIKQLNNVYLTKIKENFTYDETKNYALLDCCTNTATGKAFITYALIIDHVKFNKDKMHAKLKHPIGYDASNSGTQVNAILFRDYDLASKCNLVGKPRDAYIEGQINSEETFKNIAIFTKEIKDKYGGDHKKDSDIIDAYLHVNNEKLLYENEMRASIEMVKQSTPKRKRKAKKKIKPILNKKKNVKAIALDWEMAENLAKEKDNKIVATRVLDRAIKRKKNTDIYPDKEYKEKILEELAVKKDKLWLQKRAEKRMELFNRNQIIDVTTQEIKTKKKTEKIKKQQENVELYREYADKRSRKRILSLYFNLHAFMLNETLYKLFVSRNVLKVLCMTYPYGLTPIGARKQIETKFIDMSLKKGIWLTKTQMKKLNKLTELLYLRFLDWFKKEFPLSMALREAAEKFYNERDKIPIFEFKSKYFSFTMRPLKYKETRLNLPTKTPGKYFRMVIRSPLPGLDEQKLKRATPANVVHFCDANIISAYNELVSVYNSVKGRLTYCFFTNHDCFYVPPIFILRLKPDVKQCYHALFKMKLLDNFKQHPKVYEYLQNYKKTYRKKDETRILTLENLCENPYFIK